MKRTTAALALVAGAATADEIYTGQTGAVTVLPLVDNCWDNVTLATDSSTKALIVTTSYGEPLEPSGKQSGLTLEEATAPYYVYLDAGATVDIASINGGVVPYSTADPDTPSARRFLSDDDAMFKLNNSLTVADVDFSEYDLVFMAGGWGAAFDLGYSVDLGNSVSKALYAGAPLIGSTCHGALGFVQANKTDGTPWVAGLKVTGVTNDQISELGIDGETPMHPEEALVELGADYQCIHGTVGGDVFATSVSCELGEDGSGPVLFTGQNQNSACSAAQRQLQWFLEKSA